MNNYYYLTADIVNFLTDAALPNTADAFRKDHEHREVKPHTVREWLDNRGAQDNLYIALESAVPLYTLHAEINGDINEYTVIFG